jgi:hypothetical protein
MVATPSTLGRLTSLSTCIVGGEDRHLRGWPARFHRPPPTAVTVVGLPLRRKAFAGQCCREDTFDTLSR